MKKTILSTVMLGIALGATSAFAQGVADVTIPTTPVVTSVLPVVETTETLRARTLTQLKARGAALIKQRVDSLNSNAVAIANTKGLTAEQKAAFATFISGKVTELNTLNTKIQAGVDASSTKQLVSSVFTDFRIYAIVIPQIRLEKRIYELQVHATKLGDTFTKIQTAINTAKTNGKDVTVWQKSLDDAKTLVASDTAKLPSLLLQISALKPSDYGTTSKATIEAVNLGVKGVARDFESIRLKVKRPAVMRHIMINASSTASTTITR